MKKNPMSLDAPAVGGVQQKIAAEITIAQKQVDAAKQVVKSAKADCKRAKKKLKEARRAAKKLKKELKALKAEFEAASLKKPAAAPRRPTRAAVGSQVKRVPAAPKPTNPLPAVVAGGSSPAAGAA